MATADQTREEAFETEIAEYLAAHGWEYSTSDDGYDTVRALWPEDVHRWLSTTQAEEYGKVVKTGTPSEQADRDALLDTLVARLDTPMSSGGGTLNVLRRKFSHTRGATAHFRMCQFAPATTLNPTVAKAYESVRLRVVRQLHFSPARGDMRSIDLVFFVNGLPVATLELKSFFKQEWRTAVKQYKQDRDPKGQPLLGFGTRALVHFAVDDDEVWMTTRLAGEKTYFLPFNQGQDDGAKGNPANPVGAATSYLWEEVLERRNWLNILGALIFVHEEAGEDPVTGKIRRKKTLMFPRYHQWRAVRKIITAIRAEGTGQRYLIEHSAGSGKTNTIAWTAHRLARLHDEDNRKVFDKVLIVSDRKVIDRQLQDAVEQVDDTAGSVAVIDSSAVRRSGGSKSRALLDALTGGALIVVVTIQTFPYVKGLLETTLGDRGFAVIIDEAHTSQSGKTAADLKKVLTEDGEQISEDETVDTQDVVNDLLSADDERERRIAAETAARAGAKNVSFLAFTATPKHKTKTLFGRLGDDGKPASFDVYTMRQAIEEGFILDVLRGYQNYETAFEIEQRGHDGVITTITSDDERLVDPKVATRAIMRFKNLHPSNIGQKVEVIVEHFRANVAHLLDGQAKAMVVTDSRQAAVRYKVETDSYIRAKGYKIKTIVAYSGDITDAEYGLEKATEATMNPGLGADLAREFKRPDYRLMLVAEKFQTGFDQPLLCAMYVDKKLPDVHAVQTLSRLNRTYRAPSGEVKDKTFVLDFVNDPVDIQEAFLQYYTEAHVETATDPNLVHQLATKLDQARIYTRGDVERYAEAWWGAQRHSALAAAITPARDEFANRWAAAAEREDTEALNELRTFRKDCGSYVRLYDFMSQVVDYATTDLEKLAEFLRQLVRLLAVDDPRADLDLSGIVLKRVRQIDQGTADIALSGSLETLALKGISGVGSGVTRDDPQQVLLSEVIAKINTLFSGEFADPQIGGFVTAAAGMAEEDPRIAEQIDNNAVDQFLVSPDLRETLIDAAVLNEGAFGRLTGALTGENERADEFIRLIGAYLYQTRRARTETADTEDRIQFDAVGIDAAAISRDRMTVGADPESAVFPTGDSNSLGPVLPSPDQSSARTDGDPAEMITSPADTGQWQDQRFFRAEIEDHPADQPLVENEQYTAAFSVGPSLIKAVAQSVFPDDTLAAADQAIEIFDLTVQLDSDDFEIFGQAARPLRVPRTGRSLGKARFDISPRRDGDCRLTASVHYQGNFVHQMELVIPVGISEESSVAVSTRGRPPESAAELKPRDISLLVQPASPQGFSCTALASVTGRAVLPITATELAAAVDAAREAMISVISTRSGTGELVFQTRIDIPSEQQQSALRTLARAGARLFQQLFLHPAAGADAKRVGEWLLGYAMNPSLRLTIQIVADHAPLPWAMLYLGDASEGAELSWDNFLGMRHIIEQLPLQMSLNTIDNEIASTPKLSVSVNVNTSIDPSMGITLVADHQKQWNKIATDRTGLVLLSRSRKSEVLTALADSHTGDQVVYFYCHATAGGDSGPDRAAIIMGRNDSVTVADLNIDAPTTVQLPGKPLVFINACESAELSPLFYNGFVPYFMAKGARGVIGTECKTPVLFAIEWADAFFDRFLDGAAVGQTVLELRRGFLRDHGNPLGLIYAVHCDADTRVTPALARTERTRQEQP